MPVCGNGETPQMIPGRCCATCKRVQRTCTPEQVCKCVSHAPLCGTDVPTTVDGDCCPSCRPNPPQCNPACGDNQVCAKVGNAPVCKPKLTVALLLNATDLSRRQALCNLTRDQLRELISEVVHRYCDNPDHSTECTKFATALNHIDLNFATSFVRDRCRHDGVPLTVSAPDVQDTAGYFNIEAMFQPFSTSNAAAVVATAAANPEASGGAYDTSSICGPGTNAASHVAPSLLLLFAALVGFLF